MSKAVGGQLGRQSQTPKPFAFGNLRHGRWVAFSSRLELALGAQLLAIYYLDPLLFINFLQTTSLLNRVCS
jgi:hypothetical protein